MSQTSIGHDLEDPGVECLWLEITSNIGKFLLASIYRPPIADKSGWQKFEDNLNRTCELNIPYLFCSG